MSGVTVAYLSAVSLRRQLELAIANIALSRDRLERTERDARYGTADSLRALQARVDLIPTASPIDDSTFNWLM